MFVLLFGCIGTQEEGYGKMDYQNNQQSVYESSDQHIVKDNYNEESSSAMEQPTTQPNTGSVVEQLKQTFAGRTVQIISSGYGNQMGSASMENIHLCSNGQFSYESSDSSAYSSGDYSSYGSGSSAETGEWDIIQEGELYGLILQFPDGYIAYQIDYDSSEDRFYLDGEKVYLIENNYCN